MFSQISKAYRVSLCLAAMLGLLATSASVSAAVPNDDLQKVGAGEMKWGFFDLYSATFYAQSGSAPQEYPVALTLQYKRKIDSKNLVEATEKEWRRMEVQAPKTESWLQQLAKLWPDVVSGDELTCYVDGRGYATFLLNGNRIGAIEDPDFAKYFLAIWLSSDARNQELRKQLLGGSLAGL